MKAYPKLLAHINETPPLLSLLHDLDLMPEQLREGTQGWNQMLVLASWSVSGALRFEGQPKEKP